MVRASSNRLGTYVMGAVFLASYLACIYFFGATKGASHILGARPGMVAALTALPAVAAYAYYLLSRRQQNAKYLFLALPLALVAVSGKLNALSMVILLGSASLAVGSAMSSQLFRRPSVQLLDVATSLFLGMIVNAYLIWVAMHYRVNYGYSHFVLLAGELALFHRYLIGPWQTLRACVRNPEPAQRAVLTFMVFYLPYALVPFYGWDDLGVHLYIPKYVSLFGFFDYSARYAPSYDHAILPRSMYTALFLTGGEYAVRLFNFLLFPLSFLLLEESVRERWGRRASLLATLGAMTTPYLMWQIGTVFIDGFALLSASLVTFAALRTSALAAREIVLAFVLFAGAYISKQLAVFVVAPFGALLLHKVVGQGVRERSLRHLKHFGIGVICFACMLAPMIGETYAKTGSFGLYGLDPIIRKVLGLPAVMISASHIDGRWNHPLRWNSLYDITFHGDRYLELGPYGFGFLYFVCLPLFPLLLIGEGRRRQLASLLLVFVLAVLLWFNLTGPYLRYFVTIMPIGSLLIGVSLDRLLRSSQESQTAFRAIVAMVGSLLLLNFAAQFRFGGSVAPYPVREAISGDYSHSSARYLLEEKRLLEFAGIKFGREGRGLQLNLKPLLYHGDNHFEGSIYYSHWLNREIFGPSKSAEDLCSNIFLKHAYDYVVVSVPSENALVNTPEFRNFLKQEASMGYWSLYTLSPEARKRLSQGSAD